MADGSGLVAVSNDYCWRCGMTADHYFGDGCCWACTEYAPSDRGAKSPCSNTGQNALIPKRRGSLTKPRRSIPKGDPGVGALVDYLSLTLSDATGLLELVGEEDFAAKLIAMLFGRACGLTATELSGAGFQGYTNSALVIGPGGEVAGKVGIGGNNDTAHVSLTGAGTACITDWQRAVHGLLQLGARITRCDLAFDDYLGQYFDPRDMHEAVQAGELVVRANGPGKPPKTRYVTDHGSGAGCTFYAGQKGHKELCVYHKGREQGDPDSPWVRVEVRFYSKRQQLPPEMLLQPLAYLRAAYNVCEAIPADVTERLRTVRAKVEATAVAWARFIKNQVGRSLTLVHQVFGDDADAYIREALCRPGVPGRFKGFSSEHLMQYLREGLGHVDRRDSVGALA
ncbi:replication initiation factor domain-containing protein [Lysobacter antibioticus]|uniref:replication initiation factor domain-containing protein n=1 Tax=Lysobacter antibioticus TaxID=84531 RepID=UPI0016474BCD|nr:replication initiation factor domain-containing protein [Lysobacter antibioticus]